MKRRLWTREELILSLSLYLQLPFGKLHSRTPEIIYLANIIGRTPGAVAMRLNNFASVDSFHQKRGVVGLSGGKKQVEYIWNEFIHNRERLLYESEMILAKMEHKTIEEKYTLILRNIDHLKGETKIQEVKARVNQNVFRQIVLVNYSKKCAVSGIDIPELLVASHIVPWSKSVKDRLNPENGICLSALYDKAFDQGLIGFNNRYEVILSNDLKKKQKEEYYDQQFSRLDGVVINLPQKYLPKKVFLEYHYDTIFRK